MRRFKGSDAVAAVVVALCGTPRDDVAVHGATPTICLGFCDAVVMPSVVTLPWRQKRALECHLYGGHLSPPRRISKTRSALHSFLILKGHCREPAIIYDAVAMQRVNPPVIKALYI